MKINKSASETKMEQRAVSQLYPMTEQVRALIVMRNAIIVGAQRSTPEDVARSSKVLQTCDAMNLAHQRQQAPTKQVRGRVRVTLPDNGRGDRQE